MGVLGCHRLQEIHMSFSSRTQTDCNLRNVSVSSGNTSRPCCPKMTGRKMANYLFAFRKLIWKLNELFLFQVMVKTISPTFFILLLTTSTVLASICPKHQYLNAQLQRCMNCTECSQGTIVLLPCELHRDTHCGPISDLSELLVENSGNPHRHHHDRHRHEKHRNKEGEIVWR